jgi:hypothetical protein
MSVSAFIEKTFIYFPFTFGVILAIFLLGLGISIIAEDKSKKEKMVGEVLDGVGIAVTLSGMFLFALSYHFMSKAF